MFVDIDGEPSFSGESGGSGPAGRGGSLGRCRVDPSQEVTDSTRGCKQEVHSGAWAPWKTALPFRVYLRDDCACHLVTGWWISRTCLGEYDEGRGGTEEKCGHSFGSRQTIVETRLHEVNAMHDLFQVPRIEPSHYVNPCSHR